jgi:hypothetical protein
MTNSKAWVDCIEKLRTEVETAGFPSWETLHHDADSLIETARSFVRITPSTDAALDAAFGNALRRCKEFAEEIGGRGPDYLQNDPATSPSPRTRVACDN